MMILKQTMIQYDKKKWMTNKNGQREVVKQREGGWGKVEQAKGSKKQRDLSHENLRLCAGAGAVLCRSPSLESSSLARWRVQP